MSSTRFLRRTQTDLDANARWEVLSGGFDAATTTRSPDRWHEPTWKLMVFVSSTFTDTTVERNIIIESILPRLKARARPYGIQVIFIDMRWGVRDENTLEHLTWIACAKELERCQTESNGIFFLSLQSYKYGYMPLPLYIAKAQFEARLAAADVADRELASKWYFLDTNAIPAQYQLRNLEDMNDSSYWKVALPSLLNCFQGLPLDTDRCPGLFVGRSVTEYEVTAAITNATDLQQAVWCHRHFTEGVAAEDDPWKLFDDTKENDATRQKLVDLKAFMQSNFLPQQVDEFNLSTHAAYVALSKNNNEKSVHPGAADFAKYISAWEKAIDARLSASLEDIISLRERWAKDGCGMNVPGEELTEALHHCSLASRLSGEFYYREKVLLAALNLLAPLSNQSRQRQSQNTNSDDADNPLQCISLCIFGASGSGTSALLAKLACEIYQQTLRTQVQIDSAEAHDRTASVQRPIIIRFCGTSFASKSGVGLVRSICSQIERIYGLEVVSCSAVCASYDQLVDRFAMLLQEYPVVLFIDSLERLSDQHQECSRLSFLRHVQTHPDTLLVVSFSSSSSSLSTSRQGHPIASNVCETLLKTCSTMPSLYMPSTSGVATVDAEPTAQICAILTKLLENRKRRLTDVQLDYVRDKVKNEPSPLYARLALFVLVRWTSNDVPSDDIDSPVKLGSGVAGIVNQIMDRAELSFGRVLVRAVLAFITFSVNGVNDDEMIDLLSLNKPVLDSVFQYSKADTPRLPHHVWMRVRGELEDLLVEQQHHCLVWKSLTVKNVISERYEASERLSYHTLMARYFANLVPGDDMAASKCAAQALVLSDEIGIEYPLAVFDPASIVNTRRCQEAAEHLFRSSNHAKSNCSYDITDNEMLLKMQAELCTIQGICCRLRANVISQLLDELLKLKTAMKNMGSAYARTADYCAWLLVDIHRIATDPIGSITAYASTQPEYSHVFRDLTILLKAAKMQSGPVDLLTSIGQKQGVSRKLINTVPAPATERCCWIFCAVAGGIAAAESSVHDVVMLFGERLSFASSAYVVEREGIQCCEWSADGNTIAVPYLTPSKTKSPVKEHVDNIILLDSVTGNIRGVLSWEQNRKFRSQSRIQCLKWCPTNPQILASCDNSREWGETNDCIRIWSTTTTLVLLHWEVKEVKALDWSPDGTKLCSCSGGLQHGQQVDIWDASSGTALWHCRRSSGSCDTAEVMCVGWSPCGSLIAAGFDDGSVCLWDEVVKTVKDDDVEILTASSRATAQEGQNARLRASFKSIDNSEKKIVQLAWHSRSKWLAVVPDWGSSVEIYDVVNMCWQKASLSQHGPRASVQWYPSNSSSRRHENLLVSCTSAGLVRIWNAVTATVLAIIERNSTIDFQTVRWQPSSSPISDILSELSCKIALGSTDNICRVYDCRRAASFLIAGTVCEEVIDAAKTSGHIDHKNRTHGDIHQRTFMDSVRWIAWLDFALHGGTSSSGNDSETLVWEPPLLIASSAHCIRIIDVQTGSVALEYSLLGEPHSVLLVNSSCASAVLKVAAQLYGTNTIGVYDFVKKSSANSGGSGHSGPIRKLEWTPSGSYLASTGEDLMIKVWTVTKTQVVIHCVFNAIHKSPVNSIVWTGDGKHLASKSETSFVCLHWVGGQHNDDYTENFTEQCPIPRGADCADMLDYSGMSWNRQGTRLCCGDADTVFVLTVDWGRARPQNDVLNASGETAKCWQWRSLCPAKEDKHAAVKEVTSSLVQNAYSSSAWHPAGVVVAVAYNWFFFRIWDTDSSCVLCTLESVTMARICSLCWTATGNAIAGGDTFGVIHVWTIVLINQSAGAITAAATAPATVVQRVNADYPLNNAMITTKKAFKRFLRGMWEHAAVNGSPLPATERGLDITALMLASNIKRSDAAAAERLYITLAQAGNPLAQQILAVDSLNRDVLSGGVSPNTQKWAQLSANSGNSDAQLLLAKLFEMNGNLKQAVKYLRLSAESGNSDAQFTLAMWYRSGHPAVRAADFGQAVRYFKKCACHGNVYALMELTRMGVECLCVGGMPDRALLAIETAAKLGFPEAQLHLGNIYKEGLAGVAKSPTIAFSWYFKAASERGLPMALFAVADCYNSGSGVEHSEEKELYYLRLAAERCGLPCAMVALGNKYKSGTICVPQDVARGEMLIEKAHAAAAAAAAAPQF